MGALQAFLAALQALAPVIALVLIKAFGQQQARQGAQLEAAKTDQVTAVAQAAIAQAEVAAPATRLAVVDQLKQGTF